MWIKLTSLKPKEGMLIIIRWSNSDNFPVPYMYEAGVVTSIEWESSPIGEISTVNLWANDKENSALNTWKLTVTDGEWKEIEKD